MNMQYLQYGQRLNTIGDLIIEISNLINPNQVSDNMEESIERYKYALDQLSSVKAPEVIGNEHKQLLNALDEWIQSTEKLNASIGSQKSFEKAMQLQKEKEIKIGTITSIIGDKLTK
ncbi:hypothetical protein SAFG77S_09068 [Streptomyces afghaniensis]